MANPYTGSYVPNSAISTQAESLANERFQIAQDYSDQTFETALSLLEDLGDAAIEIDPIGVDVSIAEETLNLSAILSSGKPSMGQTPGFTGITSPTAPTIPDIIIEDLNSIPSFDVQVPTFNIPDAPNLVEPADPGDAPNIQQVDSPAPPSFTLPDVPTFNEVSLPADPEISIAEFDGVEPTDSIQLPDTLSSYNPGEEDPYESDLKNAIQTYILAGIDAPGTGISESIETDIYERERERRDTLLQESKENFADELSARGAPIPDGALLSGLVDIQMKHDQDRLDRAREISIKQVELAQEFIRFCIEKGITFEDIMIRLFNDVLNRAFEISKYVNEVALLYYRAQVELYNIRLEAYKTKASIYEIRIRAALLDLEIYKGKLEAANVRLQVNSEEVKLYVAQVQGVEALIRLYQSEIENAKTKAELNRLSLDGYKTKVEAYVAKVGSLTARYQAYEAQMRGEATKAQVYGNQVDAYKTRVEAASIEERINIERARTEGEVLQRKVDLFRAEIEKYRSEVDAKSTETNAIIEEFRGEIQAYSADAQAASVLIQTEINQFNARIAQSNNTAQLAIKQAEINIREALETNALKLDAIKAEAQIAAQIGASALSGVSASAQLSAGAHVNASIGQSYSESYNVSREVE